MCICKLTHPICLLLECIPTKRCHLTKHQDNQPAPLGEQPHQQLFHSGMGGFCHQPSVEEGGTVKALPHLTLLNSGSLPAPRH